ncbi:WD40 domain protein beta Propeller [Anaeromyxobacter sp. K]|uniref:PD40 domain-containing protein n=1 Tax=Anaeromyxobacter sp. (strain K) TaxID=447217 RepID=UPI00017BE2F6|nr:PD40 domain-containing protein [Anaeromyxobacter sp. K]ACG74207.1 WD40 domain protein beta Propeller [Anaeromyxobacter sp. K]
MPDSPPTGSSGAARPASDRLESWKEIATYLRRDVTTVQRWERREGMPVHRHVHDKLGSVYAFRSDLDAWARRRSAGVAGGASGEGTLAGGGQERDPAGGAGEVAPLEPVGRERAASGLARSPRPAVRLAAAIGVAAAIGAGATWLLQRRAASADDPLSGARFAPLTDFGGVEQAAAISADGRFVAFLSDRAGRVDVWLTQVGSGQFQDLTRGSAPELVNPSIRTLGFSPDGALVTFWARGRTGSSPPDIGIWAVPLLGGPPRPYLEGAAEYAWTRDGTRLVHHTPGPGDPMYVSEAGRPHEARRIFSAPSGLHAHFQVWSPDQAFIYFVQGALPDRLDLWRIRPDGSAPERLTHHDGLVSHPVFADERTLLYLATDPDGSGPWLHALDVEGRATRRVAPGAGRYTSLAASADGRRLVLTQASPKRTLWRVPLGPDRADLAAASPIPLTTGNGWSPRLGPGYLVYLSAKGAGDGLWKLQDGASTELWSQPGARIAGAPAVRRDGRTIAFWTREGGRTRLRVVDADGTGARVVTDALQLSGAPAWMPDGRSIAVGAIVEGAPRLFRVPLDGGEPAALVAEPSADPAWAPAGDLLAFTGADVGTTFPLRAVNADGSARRMPPLTLTRGARHVAFLPDGRSIAVLRGEIRRKHLAAVDLASGASRPLVVLPPDFDVGDFDVSPDGRELVLEQVQERSDLVLVERPGR